MEATSTATSTGTFTAQARKSSVSKLLNFNRKTLMHAWILEIDVRHALMGIRNRRTYNYWRASEASETLSGLFN